SGSRAGNCESPPAGSGDKEAGRSVLSGLQASIDQTEKVLTPACAGGLQRSSELAVDGPCPEGRAAGAHGLAVQRVGEADEDTLTFRLHHHDPTSLCRLQGCRREARLEKARCHMLPV